MLSCCLFFFSCFRLRLCTLFLFLSLLCRSYLLAHHSRAPFSLVLALFTLRLLPSLSSPSPNVLSHLAHLSSCSLVLLFKHMFLFPCSISRVFLKNSYIQIQIEVFKHQTQIKIVFALPWQLCRIDVQVWAVCLQADVAVKTSGQAPWSGVLGFHGIAGVVDVVADDVGCQKLWRFAAVSEKRSCGQQALNVQAPVRGWPLGRVCELQAADDRQELGARQSSTCWDIAVLQGSSSGRLRLPWASLGSLQDAQSRSSPRTHRQHVEFANTWAVDI